MRPEDFTLEPHHITEATLADGRTNLVIRLASMTWYVKLICVEGDLYGDIRDEHGAPVEDGHQILNWIVDQPRFVRRIWELALVERDNRPEVERGKNSGR